MDSCLFVKSVSDDSGDITLTSDYFIIKGKHYIFRDWILNKSQSNASILTKDILSIEIIPYRSKKLFISFIILTTIFFMFCKMIYKINLFITVMLAFVCCVLFLLYIFSKLNLFRVTSKGITVALDTRYYNLKELENVIYCWTNMLS